MDPAWDIGTGRDPIRGVALPYGTISDEDFMRMDISRLLSRTIVVIWTLPSKLDVTMRFINKHHLKVKETITWVKTGDANGQRPRSSNGPILQRSNEIAIMAMTEQAPEGAIFHQFSNTIFEAPREQSRKPTEMYRLLDNIVIPSKTRRKMELFGRYQNLRAHWMTLGNEL